MPNKKWTILNGMQLGRYAEYYAKMEFTSYGYEVYTSEVDDHGVDFVTKKKDADTFYEVQVKSIRGWGYVFMTKDKMPLTKNRIVCLLRFEDESLPEVYIIPAEAWKQPNQLLVDRNYKGEEFKSKPEWGINISRKNVDVLEKYKAENFFKV